MGLNLPGRYELRRSAHPNLCVLRLSDHCADTRCRARGDHCAAVRPRQHPQLGLRDAKPQPRGETGTETGRNTNKARPTEVQVAPRLQISGSSPYPGPTHFTSPPAARGCHRGRRTPGPAPTPVPSRGLTLACPPPATEARLSKPRRAGAGPPPPPPRGGARRQELTVVLS